MANKAIQSPKGAATTELIDESKEG